MFKLTRIHWRHPVDKAQHDRQRDLVLLSTRLSGERAERAQEAATQARLYSTSQRTVMAVPVNPPVDLPPAAA